MANSLPPLPLKTPLTDKNGFLSPAWAGFFVELFNRVGGNIAPSNSEINTSTTTIQSQITALQTKDNDFGQGPNL